MWLMETLGDGRGEEHHVPVLGCWVQFWQEAVLAVALSLHFVLVEGCLMKSALQEGSASLSCSQTPCDSTVGSKRGWMVPDTSGCGCAELSPDPCPSCPRCECGAT